MKEEVQRWLTMAKDDLASAKTNLKNRKYYVCAFLSQQAAEKALKALLIKKKNKLFKIHDLVILGRIVELPENLIKKAEQLSQVYIESRYGAVNEIVPSKKFKKQNSEEYLAIATELLKWAKENI